MRLITYTLTITHSSGISPTTNVVLTDTLPTGSTFVSATSPYTFNGDVIRWDFPSLSSQAAITVTLVVKVDLTASGTLSNSDYGVLSDQVALIRWSSCHYAAREIALPPPGI